MNQLTGRMGFHSGQARLQLRFERTAVGSSNNELDARSYLICLFSPVVLVDRHVGSMTTQGSFSVDRREWWFSISRQTFYYYHRYTEYKRMSDRGRESEASSVSMYVRYLKSQHLHLSIEQIAKLVRFETTHRCDTHSPYSLHDRRK